MLVTFSTMKNARQIREFIWQQHPLGIMYMIVGFKMFVSLHIIIKTLGPGIKTYS